MTAAARLAIDWVEQGLVPDGVVRRGIRRLLAQRLQEIGAQDCASAAAAEEAVILQMDRSPVALVPELANAQHYELPAAFYAQFLGPHRKYSACYWDPSSDPSSHDLEAAEARALELTCMHADVEDGQDILELGCGWGSLSLWMAQRYPRARITAVSNAPSQRAYIEQQARQAGLTNLNVITADMNDFAADSRFDRVVSVEMFEHMRNWRELLRRVHTWLRPGGRFLMHVFCHRSTPYFFADQGPTDWMGRHFFSGGLMPSDDLALRFQDHLRLRRRWRWDGRHYERTLNAWLANMDANRTRIRPILEQTYGVDQADLWWQRWRIFLMACAELFGYEKGQQWWVSHYLFERPTSP
jgi:cyclopropane-fatty-acyl-phospholipid synthase